MILSDYIASFIADQGTRHVFLLPGGGNMHLVDSFGREKRLELIACLHEQVASIAAEGYAQYTRNLGVALVTTGPGGTNAITGVAAAWTESTPLFVLSGQVKTSDIKPSPEMRMLGFQETDITAIVKPITKYSITVRDPKTIKYHLEKAAFLARTGRPGPVWLAIPLDIQAYSVNPDELEGFDPAEVEPRSQINSQTINETVEQTLNLLRTAHRPVLIAGYGIKLSQCEIQFTKIVERLGIPVLTTWKACDLLPEKHHLFYGRPGSVGQRGANFIQQNSDFVLAIGARLDFGQIGYASETFARSAKKVIVDIDPLELAKFRFKVDLPIVGNAFDYLRELEIQSQSYQAPIWDEWIERCTQWKNNYPTVLPEYFTQKDFVSTYVLFDTLSDKMTSEDLLVPGSSGNCSDICMQVFRVKQGQHVQNSLGFGSMGFGIPHTIGACLASDRKRTICVNGDGGFQLNIQDLETVHRLNLPIKYFYLNNQGYASIRGTQNNYFEGRLVASNPASGLSLPDIRKISDAYKIPNNRIANLAELEQGVSEAFSSAGPFICEVMINPSEEVKPKVKSAMKTDGTLYSKPLEDLWPFLDRKEFLSNMIVMPLPE